MEGASEDPACPRGGGSGCCDFCVECSGMLSRFGPGAGIGIGRVALQSGERAKERGLHACKSSGFPSHERGRASSVSIVDKRRAISWEMAVGAKDAASRLVAKGCRGADLKCGSAHIPARVRPRSSHLQAIFLGALKSGTFGARTFRLPVRELVALFARNFSALL